MATNSIHDNITDVNSKTFYLADSFMKPLGSKVSPRILLRGDWITRDNSLTDGTTERQFNYFDPYLGTYSTKEVFIDPVKSTFTTTNQFCVEMVGWVGAKMWNQIALDFFTTESNSVETVRNLFKIPVAIM